jgi:hypothetical protein
MPILESGQLVGHLRFVNAFRPDLAQFACYILIRLPVPSQQRKQYSMILRIAILISLTAILSACAAPQGEFPSLMRRPYETNAPITAPLSPETAGPATLSSDLAATANALAARHRAAHNAYRELLTPTASAARGAAGTAVGSEAWVAAQLQVSRLDKARADSKAALAELDRLITAQLDAGANGTGVDMGALLIEYQTPIAADTAAQDAEIERLSALIGF